MGLYLTSGYLDFEKIVNYKLPFNFIIGGRGSGKTYGALKYVIDHHNKFLLLRRLQSQIDLVGKPEFSPFKAVAADMGIEIGVKSISKYNSVFLRNEEVLGYSAALSTISNLRGFDASDVEMIIYDEFIPEPHEKPMRAEGTAFLNMYETVNRNRELKGCDPVQLIALANSNDLANAIFIELGIVDKVQKMAERRQEIMIDRDRGIGIFMLDFSPISNEKRKTALYRLMAAENDFTEMALNNSFSGNTIERVESHNLKEYTPLLKVGELSIYKHKSRREYYVTTHASGSVREIGTGDLDLKRFRTYYNYLWESYLAGNMVFESYALQVLFEKYMDF